MLLRVKQGGCSPLVLVAVNAALACVDGIIAGVAFSQLVRIHLHNQWIGWTRQKVFHLVIGCSNIGFVVYFISTLFATCGRCFCWSLACRFILMAFPQILFLAAFLLLLSFWVDLCHQANDEDEDDEENISGQPLLGKVKTASGSHQVDNHRRCLSCNWIHVGSRQKFVILVILLTFILMMTFAVLIWVGKGKNPIDSSTVARVYLDLFSIAILILGGALACYGVLLFLKMSKVRSEQACTEMWKVSGLAVVSVVCFTSCALVALITNIPVLYHEDFEYKNAVKTSILIIVYYFIGSSVPSGFVLWVMREMPPRHVVVTPVQSRVVTYIRDGRVAVPHTHRWTTATSSQNQASKASPI
ncbi:hypothetical protein H6P81_014104 [Aristolochia fimbriata]|uniref:THH1/TOM1/TOM3 domain-containing protein n=1 Tax=Aristolochia fimbriata TaxID=158543 RepID=A0AAV7EJW6_ARIFI|nr:hypothetical protein H6P81_014104 [Aristolochia fimbriata]